MKVPTRLATYAVGLVALFAIGLGAGALLGADDSPASTTPAGPSTSVEMVPTTEGGMDHG